jgi:hypothetical protein
VDELPIETTVYSMSDDPPPETDRRTDERHLTLFRVGTIILGDQRELCLVKNLSGGGALVRVYCTIECETRLHIELKEQQPIPGKVTWVRGGDVGITFDEPVDVVEILTTSADGPKPRMPRIETNCVCFVREGAVVNRVVLLNISQGGLSVESPNNLTVGGHVTVSLPGLRPQGATVRWNDGSRYGISFNTVLPLAGLVDWLQSRKRA